jgi:hypothetical protein
MCRNIKRLRRDDPPVTRAEFEEAARNLVRKLSGFREPSPKNRDVFEQAVADITAHSIELFERLRFKGGVTPCVET